MMRATVTVGDRVIGAGAPVFIVAEAGVNHNGDVALARELIDVAADAGADAVKFQTFHAPALVSREAPKAAYQRETTGGGESQLDMLRRLELGLAEHADLKAHCAKRGVMFFSAAFDDASADALESLGVQLFKLPSGELTNLPLVRRLAAKRRPIIVSTGMATMDEVARALAAIREAGDPAVALLHCLSAYPAPAAEMNLRAMDQLRDRFGCPVGLSDHTIGIAVALAAVGRGAAIIEKHFTVDKRWPGPDHRASLDPRELAEMVRGIREVESALGDGDKRPMPSELDTRRVARKSVVAARPIAAGQRLTPDLVAVKRPGTGISPAELPRVIGRKALRALAADELIEWTDLSEP